jgi:hypothetical protein
MSWMWINLPLAIVFFGAWTGIPLYMVLRHPSWGAESAHHSADALVSSQGGDADWEMLVSASAVAEAVHEAA